MMALLARLFAASKLYALAGLFGVAFIIGVYQAGANAERKRGEAARLRVELTVTRNALTQERDDAAALEAETQKAKEALDALKAQLATRQPADQCPASETDIDALYR